MGRWLTVVDIVIYAHLTFQVTMRISLSERSVLKQDEGGDPVCWEPG